MQSKLNIRLAAVAGALCAVGVLALAGCRSQRAADADPAKARDALAAGLDAWKRGEGPEALARQSPAIYFHDRDWRDGQKLLEFRLAGEPTPFGYGVQYTAILGLQDKDGRKHSKSVIYVINTDSAISIARHDVDS